MKNYFVLIVLACLVFSCAPVPHDGFVLTGKVPAGWEGKTVILRYDDTKDQAVIDSTTIRDGRFMMKGKFDLPRFCSLLVYLDPTRQNAELINSYSLFLDTTAVEVIAMSQATATRATFSRTGGAAQDEYEAYKAAYTTASGKYKKKFSEYSRMYYQEKDLDKAKELVKELSGYQQELQEFKARYIEEHSETMVSLQILREILKGYSGFTMNEMMTVFNSLSQEIRESAPGQYVEELIKSRKMVIGNHYPDLVLKDLEGNPKKISEMVRPGHCTLLELWASWCAPCRGEIPHMKRLYKQYHPRGFDIVSISVDTDLNNWHKAVENEKMPWEQLVDNEHVAFKAAFETWGVPTSILIDGEGRILNLNARGGWLDIALEEIYSK